MRNLRSFFRPASRPRSSRHAPRWCALAAVGAALLGGCGKPPAFQFDELDGSRGQMLNELSLGQYKIPVPVVTDRADDNARRRNRLRFDFELHALVTPQKAAQIADGWARHEGKIRDRVMKICRNATVDDLHEPELTTLKARLIEALQSELGGGDIRRLLMTEVVSQEL